MKFKLNESCILSDFEDGLLVLNIETGKYLELNSIAAEIIQYLKENLAIDEKYWTIVCRWHRVLNRAISYASCRHVPRWTACMLRS